MMMRAFRLTVLLGLIAGSVQAADPIGSQIVKVDRRLSGGTRTAAPFSFFQFRGPLGNGHVEASLPIKWSETSNIQWKTPVDGKAWASPVVWGNRIWLANATPDGRKLSVVCVDADSGDVLIDRVIFEIAEPAFCHNYNSYASCTPVVDRDRIWVHFGSAGTACLSTSDGSTIWSRQDLPCDHHRGPGSSPIVFEDKIFLTFDGFDQQYVVALNKDTGKTVWKVDRNIDYGTDNGDAKKAYSTPHVIEHGGRTQLISPAAAATISYDPRSGKELWRVRHGGFNAAARPLYAHGMVILNLEGGMRLLAVRPDGEGDVTETHVVWKTMKSTPTRPSQLVIGDDLFMVNDHGIVSCLDAKSGEAHWTHRMGSRHTASPIYAKGHIFFFAEDGMMRVIRANREKFELVAENPLAAGCMASPAVVGSSLIVRTKTHLYRITDAAGR